MHRKIVALLALIAPLLPAQEPERAAVPERPDLDAVDAQVARALTAFGRSAISNKMPSRARRAYALVLEHYDADSPAARRGLGFKRVKGEWQRVTEDADLPRDTASAAQSKRVAAAWRRVAQKCCKLHREAGLALLARDEYTLGTDQLERALTFDPDDEQSHQGLGHEKFGGFCGTADEVAFAKRLRQLFDRAGEIAGEDHETTALPAERMPRELRATGLDWRGAKSSNFRVWVVGSDDAAARIALWQQRALALMQHVSDSRGQRMLRSRLASRSYVAVVRTLEDREQMMASSPAMLAEYTLDQARLFGGLSFRASSGRAEWSHHDEEIDADRAVAHVAKRYLMSGRSPGFGEGFVHAATWLLCGTVQTSYMNLPHTVGGGYEPLQHDPKAWLERLQDEIDRGEDCPVIQVPRERMDNFRDSTRVKSWSFIIWLLGRYPREWGSFVDAVSKPEISPEAVEAAFVEVFERSFGEIEEEWRRWARRGSRLGRASGFSG